jgi:hypothetical protein
MEMVNVRETIRMCNVRSVLYEDGIGRDVIGIVWCLRGYNDACLLRLKQADCILHVSKMPMVIEKYNATKSTPD